MPVSGLFTLETSQIRLSRITLNRTWVAASSTPSGNKLFLPDERTPLVRIPKDGKALHALVELPLERTFILFALRSHLPASTIRAADSFDFLRSVALSQARLDADDPPLRPYRPKHRHKGGRLPPSCRRRARLFHGRRSGSRLWSVLSATFRHFQVEAEPQNNFRPQTLPFR
jgi:hypothetical protein